MTKPEIRTARDWRADSRFDILASFVIRHSDFVIPRRVTHDPSSSQSQTDVPLAGGVDPPARRRAGGPWFFIATSGQAVGGTGGARASPGHRGAAGARVRHAPEN